MLQRSAGMCLPGDLPPSRLHRHRWTFFQAERRCKALRFLLATAFASEVHAVHGDELSTAANTKKRGRLNMTTRHVTSNSNSAKPASESSTAAGFHVVGRYRNADGSVGVEIRVNAGSSDGGALSYIGLWGVGRPANREGMRDMLRVMLNAHRGAIAEIPFGNMGARA
ncbi:hypothetical protein [Stenotrophomonas maltophilia]|uniref:hypothetical protein n=2 Tax=Stenotrophomonas maltophilia TaxID=40324 RepID=UPI001FA801F6|nr:hypothetical protein [Stenotrophomonas maltophilia]